MKNNYVPRPNSLAAKVIAHLFDSGAERITPREICTLFGAESGSISNLLKAAVAHGGLLKLGVGSQVHYYLAGADPDTGTNTAGESALAAVPIPRRLSALRGMVKKKVKAPAKRGAGARAAAAKKRASEPEPPPVPAVAALYSDGDVALFGVQHTGDDGCILSDDIARRVHAFLERIYSVAVALADVEE